MTSIPDSTSKMMPPRFVSARAILVALVLTLLSGCWIRETETVARVVLISESMPTVPAMAALLVLILANVALRRTRWALSRGEILFIFFFVCVATAVFGNGIVRFLIAIITAPFYFAQPGNRLAEAQQHIPSWAAPRDPLVIRRLFEGLSGADFPWAAWATPVAAWTGFLLALWLSTLCLVFLVFRVWLEEEKLAFPLDQLPLEITDTKPRPGGVPPFFRNRVMWAGFSLAFGYNAVNMAHAFAPPFPTIGPRLDLPPPGAPPWDAFGPLSLSIRPELIGLGYLVSTEISFSIWFCSFCLRLAAVAMSWVGYREVGVPFAQEQSLGAYLALAFLFLHMGRRHLGAIARAAVFAGAPEMRGYRGAFWGFVVSFAALLFFCRLLGVMPWAAVIYVGITLGIAFTYARLRAEAGIPLVWLFPYGMPKTVLFSLFGTAPLAPGGDPSALTGLAMLSVLSRGFPVALAGYQVGALHCGQRVSEAPWRTAAALTLALVVGVILAFYFHLTGFYRQGAQNTPFGMGMTGFVISEVDAAINQASSPLPRDVPRIVAAGCGAAIAGALQLLRARLVGFPLHPLGYAAAAVYGELLWFPFLVVWICKVLVVRFGGIRLYRQSVPGFLGFALGHFVVAGILWGAIGTIDQRLYQGYRIYFG
ncbi:MAG: hypothetical protein HY321_01900 [Armatimonadetes bacterium]|nr:hypothetical protein [Armatimonadota bacterium]